MCDAKLGTDETLKLFLMCFSSNLHCNYRLYMCVYIWQSQTSCPHLRYYRIGGRSVPHKCSTAPHCSWWL